MNDYELLYEKLLPVVRRAGENRALLGGALPSVWSGCQADADYAASLAGGAREKVRLWVLADYCTYVPFARAGVRFTKERLAEKSMGEYRAERLCGLLGEQLEGDARRELVFFLDDDFERALDFKTPAGAAAAVCRLYHACEANFGRERYRDFLEIAERTSDLMERFLKERGKDGLLRELFVSVPACETLNGKQKKILLQTTGLNQKGRRK